MENLFWPEGFLQSPLILISFICCTTAEIKSDDEVLHRERRGAHREASACIVGLWWCSKDVNYHFEER